MTGPPATIPKTADLARLTDAGQAWAALAPALLNAHTRPDDDAHLLALRVLVQLGLGPLASECAERLTPGAAARPDARVLIERAAALPAREFAADDRLELGRRNIVMLAEHRGVDLRDAYERWAPAERAWRIVAAPDGNVIRCPADTPDPRAWRWVCEHRAAARAFAAAHFADAASEQTAPIAVEGFSPPWVFVEVARATPRLADGYAPIIRVIQRDPEEFFEGASLIDLSVFIADERVEWFVGEDAADRFTSAVRRARGTQAIGPGVPLATVRTPIEPLLGPLVRELGSEINAETQRAGARVAARYADRTPAWWAARYERATAPGSQDPLRVLVPTTRHSTFIKHAARDLADAFERAGARTRLLIETSDHTRFNALAYHDAIEAFEPDLIVLNNYPRCERAELFPANVPFVCWIQDEMPHLFDDRVGRAQGELDFVIGHAVERLFDRCGYDAARALYTPVAVSPEKFRPGSGTPAQRDRFACEIAFVSHHSETPEAMHERKLAEVGDARTRAILAALYPRLGTIADRLATHRAGTLVHAESAAAFRAGGVPEPPAAEVAQLEVQYARPMLERIVRHRALVTAAGVCERRGWRLRVFGRGWADHPRFAAHAGGEIEHGEHLRACYASAAVHLHPSAVTMVHQRVMECALSGGLPVGVRSRWALRPLPDALRAAGVEARDAEACRVSDRALGFACADHPELLELAATWQRCGTDPAAIPAPHAWIGADKLGRVRARKRARDAGEFTAEWLLGDPAELTFADAHGLESIVERAIGEPGWRESRSRFIASRVRGHLTHDAVVRRTLQLVTGGLEAASGGIRRSA